MAQTEATTASPPAPAPKSGSKLVPMILVANLAMMSVVLVFVMRKPAAAHPEPGANPEAAGAAGEHGPGTPPGPGPILKLENFVIQLRGVDQDRYIRLAFDIEVSTEADREVVQKRLAQIRDTVISYFSDRTLDELRGSEGIERTKAAIIKRLDEIVPGRRIRALYITDLIIQ
jgi:flagellar protein FliL